MDYQKRITARMDSQEPDLKPVYLSPSNQNSRQHSVEESLAAKVQGRKKAVPRDSASRLLGTHQLKSLLHKQLSMMSRKSYKQNQPKIGAATGLKQAELQSPQDFIPNVELEPPPVKSRSNRRRSTARFASIIGGGSFATKKKLSKYDPLKQQCSERSSSLNESGPDIQIKRESIPEESLSGTSQVSSDHGLNRSLVDQAIDLLEEQYVPFYYESKGKKTEIVFENLEKKIHQTQEGKLKPSETFLAEAEETDSDNDFELKKKQKQQPKWWEQYRVRLTISTSSYLFQVLKVVFTVADFVSSFDYAYSATFMASMSEGQINAFFVREATYMSIFILELLIHVMISEHTGPEPWSLQASCERQLKQGKLAFQLFTIIPFTHLFSGFLSPRTCELLFFLKILRMYDGFEYLDHKIYTKQMKAAQSKRIQARLTSKELAESQDHDIARLTMIELVGEILKTVKLIIQAVCLSYFTGLAWFVFCELLSKRKDPDPREEFFIVEYGFDSDSLAEQGSRGMVAMTYFAFTTLSTVGLGDYHPKGDAERVLSSFFMLFGVLITSFIMQNFNEMIQVLRDFDKQYEESVSLSLFIGTLQKFNGGPIDAEVVAKYEAYFSYRWHKNRNLAVSTEADWQMCSQLPKRVMTQVYLNFLFKKFVETYKTFFEPVKLLSIRRMTLRLKKSSKFDPVTIDPDSIVFNDLQLDFILSMLQGLEPIEIQKGVNFIRPGEVTEMYFPMEGEVSVGYNHKEHAIMEEIKRMQTQKSERQLKSLMDLMQKSPTETKQDRLVFPLSFSPGQPIGLYELLYNQSAQFFFKLTEDRSKSEKGLGATQSFEAFFIRQKRFRQILLDLRPMLAKPIFEDFRNTVLLNYIEKLYLPMRTHQQKQVELERRRQDDSYNQSKIQENLLRFMKKETPKPEQDSAAANVRAYDRNVLVQLVREMKLSEDNQVRKRLNILRYKNMIITKEMPMKRVMACLEGSLDFASATISTMKQTQQEATDSIISEMESLYALVEELVEANARLEAELQKEKEALVSAQEKAFASEVTAKQRELRDRSKERSLEIALDNMTKENQHLKNKLKCKKSGGGESSGLSRKRITKKSNSQLKVAAAEQVNPTPTFTTNLPQKDVIRMFEDSTESPSRHVRCQTPRPAALRKKQPDENSSSNSSLFRVRRKKASTSSFKQDRPNEIEEEDDHSVEQISAHEQHRQRAKNYESRLGLKSSHKGNFLSSSIGDKSASILSEKEGLTNQQDDLQLTEDSPLSSPEIAIKQMTLGKTPEFQNTQLVIKLPKKIASSGSSNGGKPQGRSSKSSRRRHPFQLSFTPEVPPSFIDRAAPRFGNQSPEDNLHTAFDRVERQRSSSMQKLRVQPLIANDDPDSLIDEPLATVVQSPLLDLGKKKASQSRSSVRRSNVDESQIEEDLSHFERLPNEQGRVSHISGATSIQEDINRSSLHLETLGGQAPNRESTIAEEIDTHQ